MINQIKDTISPEDITSRIKSEKIGHKIYCFNKAASTNDEAKKYADEIDSDGAIFIADFQTKGKGRLGRKWVSPKGGIYFSVLLKSSYTQADLSRFYIASSVAVCLAIEKLYNLKAYIEWPNDIIVQNKKVAGILAEASRGIAKQSYLIIGIGINVNTFSDEIPQESISLREASGQFKRRAEIIAVIVNQLDEYYIRLKENKLRDIYKLWNRHCYQIGLRVVISRNDDIMYGMIMGVNEGNGSLLIRTDNGIIESVESAEEIKITGSKR